MGIHYNQGAELLDFVKNKADFNMEGVYFKPLMKWAGGRYRRRESD